MTNYAMIDGKKIELSAEQAEEIFSAYATSKLSPAFRRVEENEDYFFINNTGVVRDEVEGYSCDGERFAVANYCTNRALLEQRALHETLSRLLWRFSESNGGRGPYSIGKDHAGGNLRVVGSSYDYLDATFVSTEVAQRAIDEVVDPFIKANPDFKW